MPVDVVVVSYNSRATLRACVEPLAAAADVDVIVIDNASADGSLETVADLSVRSVSRSGNGGFALACNEGWRAGSAPFVFFLNPDATIEEHSLRVLLGAIRADDRIGAAAPKILGPDGSLHHSLRRFPRLCSTYARALFLPRLLPLAPWADEVVRDERAYERPGWPEWASGAGLLVRRSALERIGGFDEAFFLYSEDTDLCRRLRQAGFRIRYEPGAVVRHTGGGSGARADLLPLLALSRRLYARKHEGRVAAQLERAGLILEAATHLIVCRGGIAERAGRVSSLLALVGVRLELGPTRQSR
jgi:N-acetylglucosaminyl-diphospho-decaprenol L-rhamnosyltransferase